MLQAGLAPLGKGALEPAVQRWLGNFSGAPALGEPWALLC